MRSFRCRQRNVIFAVFSHEIPARCAVFDPATFSLALCTWFRALQLFPQHDQLAILTSIASICAKGQAGVTFLAGYGQLNDVQGISVGSGH